MADAPQDPDNPLVVPENVIPAEPNTSSGELAGPLVTDNGERRWYVVRLGVQVARFEMVVPHVYSIHLVDKGLTN